jgi:hypothetical protein
MLSARVPGRETGKTHGRLKPTYTPELQTQHLSIKRRAISVWDQTTSNASTSVQFASLSRFPSRHHAKRRAPREALNAI